MSSLICGLSVSISDIAQRRMSASREIDDSRMFFAPCFNPASRTNVSSTITTSDSPDTPLQSNLLSSIFISVNIVVLESGLYVLLMPYVSLSLQVAISGF